MGKINKQAGQSKRLPVRSLSAVRLCRSKPAWTAGKGVTSPLAGYRSGLSDVGGASGRSWMRLMIRRSTGRRCASVSYPFRCTPQAAKQLAVSENSDRSSAEDGHRGENDAG